MPHPNDVDDYLEKGAPSDAWFAGLEPISVSVTGDFAYLVDEGELRLADFERLTPDDLRLFIAQGE